MVGTIPSGAETMVRPPVGQMAMLDVTYVDSHGRPTKPKKGGLVAQAALRFAAAASAAPKTTATKTNHLVDHLAAENSRLRKDLAEKREAAAPQRDPLVFKGLGDNLAKYARGVRFAKPQTPAAFSRKETT